VQKDPLEAALEKIGVRLEKKDVNPLTQMLASGVGGIAGQVVGGALKLGGVGRAVVSLLGAVAGHVAVTYRIHLEKPGTKATDEGIAAVSDRR
jgi:outer membrane lipoprotein SlyB